MADDHGDEERVHWWADCTPHDWRNLRRFMLVGAAWVVTFVGGSWLLRGGLADGGFIAWIVAALPAPAAVLAVLAYGRYLRETDEFQRMIHLQALALGFGGGWLALAGWRLFELAGAPRLDRGDVLLVASIVFTVALLLGRRRYA